MRLFTLLFLGYINFGLHTYTYGQQKKESGSFAIINILLLDTAMLKGASVSFEMSNDINSNLILPPPTYTHQISELKTELKVPLSNKINYGRILYNFIGKQQYTLFEQFDNLYIFEHGDTINILLSPKKIAFNGKGSEKYNCLLNIYHHRLGASVASIKSNKIGLLQKTEIELKSVKRQIDSINNIRLNILEKYKPRLNKEIYNLISVDCWAAHQRIMIDILLGRMSTAKNINTIRNNSLDSVIKQTYINWVIPKITDKFSPELLVKSYTYCDFLHTKNAFLVVFFGPNPKAYNFSYTFKQFYDSIEKNHEGLIEEKLKLLAFHIDLNIRTDASQFLKPALNSIKNRKLKKALGAIANNYFGPAFPFELPDQYGNIRTQKEFKGKLVVLDFWFTGCLGCIRLGEVLKPIMKSFHNNPDVVFVSVSIDSNKNAWVKSVESEKYSNKDDINLYTNNLGDNHPIIKHYNIQYFPTLILISKEGKIITTPYDRLSKDKPETIAKFKEIIYQNL